MRRIILLFIVIIFAVSIYAQVPDMLSYQAVVRDANGALSQNHTVGMRVSILQGSANGTAVYIETHAATTNANGLISLMIGGGTVVSGSFSNIDWAEGPYFIETETDPTGSTSYTISGVVQLLSVPYALYAKTAETTINGLIETDPIFTAHAASNITLGNINNWNTSYGWGDHAGLYRPISYVPAWDEIAEKPTFAAVATSGSFYDLTGKPTTLSGYGITDAMSISHAANGITTSNITNWNTAYSWGDHIGLYRPISYIPAWDEIAEKPTFAAVATSGSFNDLTGKPTTLSGYGITDAMSISHAANGITTSNITNWNTAYGWGNHASAGYLTSESDPQVGNQSTNYIPRWNGSELVQGSIYDYDGSIMIGYTDNVSVVALGAVSTGDQYVAICGSTTQPGGYAMVGYSSANSSETCGVYGYVHSTQGRAIYGLADATSGLNYGVYGKTTSSNGWAFWAEGVNTYGESSSIRWKSDIKEIDNALEKVLALRGVYFNWDQDHGGNHDLGFIGEEVAEFFPEIVVIDPNNIEYVNGMDYSKMTPILLQAIKEQQRLIEELKNRIGVLENKLK